jgi:hypothetical protein
MWLASATNRGFIRKSSVLGFGLHLRSGFFGETEMADIFAAVDLTTVVAAVVVIGVAVIGVAMAFKGIDLGKRGVKKV